jgi:hypothetical protein
MKQCLICQSEEDKAQLLRLPVSLEGQPLGDFLVCSSCFSLLGQEKVAALVKTAALEKAYNPSHILTADGSQESVDGGSPDSPDASSPREAPAPRDLSETLPEAALADEKAFGAWLGEKLAPLLLGQYRQGRGQVTLLTSLVQEENQYRFRAVLSE